MAKHCVNKNTKEFKDLAEQLNISEVLLAAKVAVWQDTFGLDNFPTKDNLEVIKQTITPQQGVSELFKSNPELSEIGTEQQYSQYLNTIFPDSKVKDIVYHSTSNVYKLFRDGVYSYLDDTDDGKIVLQHRQFPEKTLEVSEKEYVNEFLKAKQDPNFSVRDINHAPTTISNAELGTGFYVSSKLDNIPNSDGINSNIYPMVVNVVSPYNVKGYGTEVSNKSNKPLIDNGFDSVVTTIRGGKEIAVFDKSQTHVLGSQQDIEGFKNHVKNDKSINHTLKAVNILTSEKAKQVFEKGAKNNWTLDKILTELQVPKEQKQIILDKGIANREEIIISLLADNTEVRDVSLPNKHIEINDNIDNNLQFWDDIYEEIFDWEQDSKQSSEILNNIQKFVKKDSELYNLIEKLKPLSLETVFEDEFNGEVSSNAYMYISNGKKIHINLEKISNHSVPVFITSYLHEVVHGYTLNEYYSNKQFKSEIDTLFKEAKSLSKNKDLYGFKESEEFISEIMTNPEFISEVKSLKKSIFQRFIDFIKSILGYKVTNNIYEESSKIINDLIDKVNEDIHQENQLETYLDFISDYGIELPSEDNKINYNLSIINALDRFINPIQGKKFRKYGERKGIARQTLRLNTKERPNLETNIRKSLQGKGVINQQIDLLFDYMKQNNLKEISVEDAIKGLKEQYGYTVEINTATKEVPSSLKDTMLHGLVPTEETLKEGYENSDEIIIANTQHYSNLTVPGGTNYTENEIVTPNITPSIKGHAQFATDNGIGWFRSDDKAIEVVDLNPNVKHGNFNNWMKDSSNTRRILEVQSDLFQKGRDKKDLTSDNINNTLSSNDRIFTYDNVLYSDNFGEKYTKIDNGILKEISKEEYEKAKSDLNNLSSNKIKSSENQFLQLLNKDNNWVTFFIKSIIQDSSKKGYEKVLFPKGDTASKIEGHATLEEFKKQKEDRIKELEGKLDTLNTLKPNEDLSPITFKLGSINETFYYKNKGFEQALKTYKEPFEKEITQLKQELADVESGRTQLSNIAKFYEETITNILKKQGYNPVEITDEHGNKWNEVTLSVEDKSNIFLNKSKPAKDSSIPVTISAIRKELSIPTKGSNQQLINARMKIKKFNMKNGTSHRVKSERIGESLTFRIIVELNFKQNNTEAVEKENTGAEDNIGGQMSLFNVNDPEVELDNKNKALLKKVNDRLLKILQTFGITVENYETLKDIYGGDVNGVADLLNKLIKITDSKFLPEEASHFIIAMIENSPYKRGLLDLARKSELYKEVYAEYMEAYENNEAKVAEEVAGKLLAQAFLEVESEGETEVTQRRLSLLAKRIWDWLQKLFTPTVKGNIQEVYNELARNVLSGTQRLDVKYLTNNSFFSLKASKIMNTGYSTSKVLEKAIETLENKIKAANRKFSKEDLKKEDFIAERERLVKQISKNLDDKKYVSGIFNFLNVVKTELFGSPDPNQADIFRFIKKFNEIAEDIDNGVNPNIVNRRLKSMHEHYMAYKPVIENIKNSLNRNEEFVNELKEQLSDEEFETFKAHIYLTEGQLTQLREDYLKLAKINTTNVITQNSRQKSFIRNKDGTLKSLDILFRDDTTLRRWLTAMTESKDEVLRVVDVMVRKAKNKARGVAHEFKVDLLNKHDELTSKGVKLNVFLEKNKGKNTGFMLSRYNRGAWIEAKKVYNKSVENITNKAQLRVKWNQFKREHGTWENPSNKYINPDFQKLSKDQREYLDLLMAKNAEIYSKIPSNPYSRFLAPQFRKDFVERVKSKGTSAIRETIIDGVTIREDETEYGVKGFTNELEKRVEFLPIYGNKFIENLEDLSDDVTSSMIAFNAYATDFTEMNKIIHSLEVINDLVAERRVLEGNVDMEDYKNKTPEELIKMYNVKEKGVSNTLERLEDYYAMQVYGRYKRKGKTIKSFKFFGKTISKDKLLDKLGTYTGLNNLAVNLYASVANFTLGNTFAMIEAIAGDSFTTKDLAAAKRELLDVRILNDIGKKVKTSKVGAWVEHFNVLQDYEYEIRDVNAERKTKAGRLFSLNTLYAGSQIGEFENQASSSIAIAKNIKLKDSKGRETNLFNAFELKNGKLQLYDTFTIASKSKLFGVNRVGTKLTEQDIANFTLLQNDVNDKLQGIYNQMGKSAAYQHPAGRLALMFRGFLVPGIQRRYKTKTFNELSGDIEEGYYVTFYNFLLNVLKDSQTAKAQLLAVLGKGENLTDEQQMEVYNIRRAVSEMTVSLALAVLLNFTLNDIDDDDWLTSMFLYQVNRLYTEVTALTPTPSMPKEFFRLLSSPAAAVNELENMSSLITTIFSFNEWSKRYEKGMYEGYTPVGKSTLRMVPMQHTVRGWFYPKPKLQFYKDDNIVY